MPGAAHSSHHAVLYKLIEHYLTCCFVQLLMNSKQLQTYMNCLLDAVIVIMFANYLKNLVVKVIKPVLAKTYSLLTN